MKLRIQLFPILKMTGMAGVFTLATITAPVARADTFYWTNIGASQIETTVTPGNTTTVIGSTLPGEAPDSLVFNSTGTQIIYSSLRGRTQAFG